MIPLKLHIKNFVSYGQTQVIDFTPFHLICLSGKNGHGKSALLDALTWSLWGQARKVSSSAKADEGLLRLGQTQMMVMLDFMCNNITYRVRREFMYDGKKSVTNLDFGICDEDNTYRSLTDKTSKITQDKIISTIGIDYESFINTAFLRQGQSNEFSKKLPRERKEILAGILGLDKFEHIRKLALEKAKEQSHQKEYLLSSYNQYKQELHLKAEIVRQLQEVEKFAAYYSAKEESFTEDLNILHIELERLQQSLRHIQSTELLTQQLSQSYATIAQSLSEDIALWRSVQRLQKQTHNQHIEEEIQNIYTQLNELQAAARTALKCKEEILALKDQFKQIADAVEAPLFEKIEATHKQMAQVQHELTTLDRISGEINGQEQAVITELQTLATEQKRLELSMKRVSPEWIASQTQSFEKRKAAYHTFITRYQAVQSDRTQLFEEKKHVIQPHHAACPLCKQSLTAEYKEALLRSFEIREVQLLHKENRIKQTLISLKAVLTGQQKELEEARQASEQASTHHMLLQELEKQRAQRLLVRDQLTHKQAECLKNKQSYEQMLSQLKEDLQRYEQLRATVRTEHIQLVTLTTRIAHLEAIITQQVPYADHEQSLVTRLSALQKQADAQRELSKDIALQYERRQRITTTIAHARTIKKQLRIYQEQLQEGAPLVAQEQLLKKKEADIKQQIPLIYKEKEQCLLKKGSLEQQHRFYEQREKEMAELTKKVQLIDQSIDEYKAIATAVSKDGIQALLIEDAIPEIEQEANHLLSRLTDNQAHLSIESLRDLKSGSSKETLDIKISDAVGVRPYELFSGGEAFRIDFALRIAISKLLARRAGTSLQTLIIDEGFGSQDEEGLHHIMEVLHTIGTDFAKVIIVSHLPQLKEQFPVNFHVYKSSQGSAIKVVEQG